MNRREETRDESNQPSNVREPTPSRVLRWILVRILGVIALTVYCSMPVAAEFPPEFKGNTSFGARRLRRQIRPQLERFEERAYDEAEINDAAYFLTEFYHSLGFPFARVTYSFDAHKVPPAVTFEIEEGSFVRLVAIKASGVKAFPPEEVAALILPERQFRQKPPFSERELERGIRNVLEKYRQAGYQDVQVVDQRVEFDRDAGTAVAHFSLNEGIRYRIADVRLRGDLVYPEEEVRRPTARFMGKPFTLRSGTLIASSLRAFYMNRGHRFCEVAWEYERDEVSGNVAIILDVEAGGSFTIRNVDTEGLRRTRRSFVLRHVSLKPGQKYSRELEAESYAALVRSGLFESVTVDFKRVDEDELDAKIRVTEAKARGAAFSLGYGSYEKLRLGMGLYDKNLLGLGKEGELGLGASLVGENAEVVLRDPSLLGSDWQGQARLFGRRREEPSFDRREYGLSFGASRPLRRTTRWFTRYEFSVSKATNIEPEAVVDDEEVSVGLLSGGFLRDVRDNILNPTRGELHSIQLDYASVALGGDLDFVRFIYQYRRFWPLSYGIVAGTGLNWTGIFPAGETGSIPIQERLFLGGATSVRSFQEGELGPKDSEGNPLGGEASTSATAELRLPLVQNLRGAIFADAGSITREANGLGIGHYSFAIGAGLRYYLPIGPIRLDYGWNPAPRENEDRSAWHLSVGFSF